GTPIDVRIDRSGEDVALAVEDRGVGVAEADLPHLFEPFYRGPAARDSMVVGSGLGLSVAHRLAGLFDAPMGAASRTDHGSTFTVVFPAAEIGRSSATTSA